MNRALVAFVFAFVPMLGESVRSMRNERALLAGGATRVRGDLTRVMTIAYPGLLALIVAEGGWRSRPTDLLFWVGLLVWTVSKALKYAAIRELGPRWSFKVIVQPGTPLVTSGPYAWMRHPNYVAVMGEYVGVALLAWAPAAGLLAVNVFGILLRRRIAIEERALGLRSHHPAT